MNPSPNTLSAAVLGLGLAAGMWALHRLHRRQVQPPSSPEPVPLVTGPLLVATRVHQQSAAKPVDVSKLVGFVERALACGDDVRVVIAVGCEGEAGASLLARVLQVVQGYLHKVAVLPVQPWGKFVPALNAITQHALSLGCPGVLFMSAETVVSPAGVRALQSHLTTRDLVVGAAFEDHTYQPGWHTLDGRTSPWNTLALWQTELLALTGFLGVAEGQDVANGRKDAGVEEVTCIAVLQTLLGEARARAKLTVVPGLQWATNEFAGDPERQAWHARKMTSKVSRPAAQLGLFGGTVQGRVLHL